jgi:hypothetical protein
MEREVIKFDVIFVGGRPIYNPPEFGGIINEAACSSNRQFSEVRQNNDVKASTNLLKYK